VTIKLLSWNVAGRTVLLPRQIEAVARRAADLVCLQEVRASTAAQWRHALATEGLAHCTNSSEFSSGRRLFNLTASRWSLDELGGIGAPQPERVLTCLVATPAGLVELLNVHVPPAPSNGLAKIETCEAIHTHLARPSDRHRVLCGDLNIPRSETSDGQVETFALNHPRVEVRWDAAERSLLLGLGEWSMTDVFRGLNGYDRGDVSWVQHTRRTRRAAYRLDHVIASDSLRAIACDYVHEWREAGLSDHSAIEAAFDPPHGVQP